MTVVTGFPFESAQKILLVCGCTLQRAFRARGLTIRPMPPVAAWASFHKACKVMNVHLPHSAIACWLVRVNSPVLLDCQNLHSTFLGTVCVFPQPRIFSHCVCIVGCHNTWPPAAQECNGQWAVIRLNPSSPEERVWGPVAIMPSRVRTSTTVRCVDPVDSRRWNYRISGILCLHDSYTLRIYDCEG